MIGRPYDELPMGVSEFELDEYGQSLKDLAIETDEHDDDERESEHDE